MEEPHFEKLLRSFRLNRIKGWINDGESILDLGCGWEARVLRHFASKFATGYGIDFKVEDVGLPPNVKVYSHHFQNLPWPVPTASVDKVTMLAVLEHIYPEDLPNVFAGIRSVLKPGGKLVLTVPTPPAKPVLEFLAYKLGIVNEDEIRDHKVYYNQALLRETLSKNGFDVVKYERFQIGFNSFCVAQKLSEKT